MRWRIRRCKTCGEYTLKENCLRCNGETYIPHPVRFSPKDSYVRYRRRPGGDDRPNPPSQ
ncbi:MAG: RNA-protein complex protein Nop10 [Candidatus Bathyarchaeia archaeon]